MKERGYAIQEAVPAMNHEHYLRQLARQRDNRMAQKRKKKEADATAIATTSDGFTDKKPLDNYTKETEECQDVKSDTSGDTSDREIRQQGIDGELPVHLL